MNEILIEVPPGGGKTRSNFITKSLFISAYFHVNLDGRERRTFRFVCREFIKKFISAWKTCLPAVKNVAVNFEIVEFFFFFLCVKLKNSMFQPCEKLFEENGDIFLR